MAQLLRSEPMQGITSLLRANIAHTSALENLELKLLKQFSFLNFNVFFF